MRMQCKSPRTWSIFIVICLVAMSALLVGSPSYAYPYTITVSQTAPRVAKTLYYREFDQGQAVPTTAYDAGNITISAVPYRIREGMTRYDQVLLNLRISPSNKAGGLADAWTHIYVKPLGYSAISDSAATRDKQLGSCTTVNLGLNASFGPISTSMDVGDLKGCTGAMVDLTSHSSVTGATGWTIRRLKKLSSTNVELYLQVPRGVRPDYRITVTRPIDSCSRQSYMAPSMCAPTDYTATASFRVEGQS